MWRKVHFKREVLESLLFPFCKSPAFQYHTRILPLWKSRFPAKRFEFELFPFYKGQNNAFCFRQVETFTLDSENILCFFHSEDIIVSYMFCLKYILHTSEFLLPNETEFKV